MALDKPTALGDGAPAKTRVRIAVLGRAGVGKTSIIRRFVHNDFDDVGHVPTLKAAHSRSLVVDGFKVCVELLAYVAVQLGLCDADFF
jgi:GTPase SAR1 family protein